MRCVSAPSNRHTRPEPMNSPRESTPAFYMPGACAGPPVGRLMVSCCCRAIVAPGSGRTTRARAAGVGSSGMPHLVALGGAERLPGPVAVAPLPATLEAACRGARRVVGAAGDEAKRRRARAQWSWPARTVARRVRAGCAATGELPRCVTLQCIMYMLLTEPDGRTCSGLAVTLRV